MPCLICGALLPGNLEAKALIDEALRNQPGLYPDNHTRRRLSLLENMPEKHAEVSDAVWADFIKGTARIELSAGAAP
jgi:hypothetical protein